MLSHLTLKGVTWAFVALFVVLVGMNYVPFLFAENGLMFGLFKLEPIANWLHVFSGIWAGFAIWYSRGAILFYYRVFGTAYFLDGVVGVFAGRAYLNLRIFDHHAEPVTDLMTRIIINIPHLVIGGAAMYIGFVLYKKLRDQ
jgi:hypothetical protein